MEEQPPMPPSGSPPPVIRAPYTAPPLAMPPPQRSSGVVWKILTFVFLLLFLFAMLVNFIGVGASHTVIPHSRASGVERARNIEEVTIVSTNSDNKIAVIEVDG